MTTTTDHAPGAPVTIDLSARPASTGTGLNPTVLGIELRRVLRNRRTMIFTLVFPVVMFLFISTQIEAAGEHTATTVVGPYIMISMAIYGAIMATTSAGASVSIERASGWSRQLRLTPLNPAAYILIKVLSALLLGALATVMTFLVGWVTHKAQMPTQVWVQSALVVVVGSLVFAAFGLFMGYLLPSENAMQFLGPILAILSIFGGIFSAPIDPASTFGRIASLSPIYGLSQIAHWPLTAALPGATDEFLVSWVVNMVAWGLLFAGGAVWRFRKDTARV